MSDWRLFFNEGTDHMPDRSLAIQTVMMPRDTNPQGTIFGGVILSHIDQAAAVGAYAEIKKAGGGNPTIVTVAMNQINFHQPVFVGDVVSFYTRPVRIGNTSITIHVDVETERDGNPLKVTEADVTYVSVDKFRRPTPILPKKS